MLALCTYPLHAQEEVWNPRDIQALNIKSIFDGREEQYDFYPNGRLAAFTQYVQICRYRPGKNTEAAFCYNLWTNPSDLDTARAEKTYGGFWGRRIVIDSVPIYIFFQVDADGQAFCVKWDTRNDVTFSRDISYIRTKKTYAENGCLTSVIQYDLTGNEWETAADTIFYAAYACNPATNSALLTTLTKWRDDRDPQGKMHLCYTCVETNGQPGVDTCHFVSSASNFVNRKTMEHGRTAAESFYYDVPNRLVFHKTYLAWWKDSFKEALIDSVYLHETAVRPMVPMESALAVEETSAKQSRKLRRAELNDFKAMLAEKKYTVEYYNK